MTRFFDLDEANATLPEVRTILESLRDERAELIRLRRDNRVQAMEIEILKRASAYFAREDVLPK